jgi:hypothetical protein
MTILARLHLRVLNYVINPYTMKAYGRVAVQIHVFLKSLVTGEW